MSDSQHRHCPRPAPSRVGALLIRVGLAVVLLVGLLLVAGCRPPGGG